MSRVWGGVLAGTGVIACPCHLPVTLPLVLGVLGGTGLGSLIGANTGVIYGIFSAVFVVGIGAGMFLLNRQGRSVQGAACDLPSSAKGQRNGRGKRRRAERRQARL